MTGEDVCLAVAADFKKNRISYEKAAEMLGKSVQTVYNRISSKRFFSQRVAMEWQSAFGFNAAFLMTGEGQLRKEVKSIFDYTDNLEVLVFTVDYLFSLVDDEDVRQMWHDVLTGDMKEFRDIEARVVGRKGLFTRLPMELQKRLAFLDDYEFMT